MCHTDSHHQSSMHVYLPCARQSKFSQLTQLESSQCTHPRISNSCSKGPTWPAFLQPHLALFSYSTGTLLVRAKLSYVCMHNKRWPFRLAIFPLEYIIILKENLFVIVYQTKSYNSTQGKLNMTSTTHLTKKCSCFELRRKCRGVSADGTFIRLCACAYVDLRPLHIIDRRGPAEIIAQVYANLTSCTMCVQMFGHVYLYRQNITRFTRI